MGHIDLTDLRNEASRLLPPAHVIRIQLNALPQWVPLAQYKVLVRSWVALLNEEQRRERTGGPP